MSTSIEQLLEAQIERVIQDLTHLDVKIAKASGNVSIGMTKLRDISDTLKANATIAIHSPKVTPREERIHKFVVTKGYKIKEVADYFGCSPSTIRRSLDKVTEANCLIGRS